MFETKFEINPPIAYIDSGSQAKIKPDFNWEMLKSKLEFYGYHDQEVIKIAKFGLKYSKCKEISGKSIFDQGMSYKHSDTTKVLLYFQSSKLLGPYSLTQLRNVVSDDIVVGKILLILKKDKNIRYVIDHRSQRLKFETLNKYPFKMRLPSLREIFIYLPVFNIKSASIVDFKEYYRQLPVNSYNYNSNILTKELTNEKSFFIDTYGQMGQKFLPVMAQRLTSSLNYIYNNERISKATSLGYQDDTVIFHFSGCPIENTDVFIKLCLDFGLEINKAKTIINKTKIVWLGVTFDFEKKIIFPSDRRILSIKKWLITFEEQKCATLREIQTVLGKISSFTYMNNIKAVMANFRSLDSEKCGETKIKLNNIHLMEIKIIKMALGFLQQGVISFDVMKFLVRPSELYPTSYLKNNRPIILLSELIETASKMLPNQNYAISVTDASLENSGGLLITSEVVLSYNYSHSMLKGLSIDKYETIVAVMGVLLGCASKIQVDGYILLTDNEVTRYIIRNNNPRATILKKLVCLLSFTMSKSNKWYSIFRISSKENIICDRLSRAIKINENIDIPIEEVSKKNIERTLKYISNEILSGSYINFLEGLVEGRFCE